MDHIIIACASVPLSHRHRDNDEYIERSILTQKQVTSFDAPQIRRIIILYISHLEHTILEIVTKVYEST